MTTLIRDETGAIRRVIIEPQDEVRWNWRSPSGLFMLPRHPSFNSIKDTSVPDVLLNKIKDGSAGQVLIQRYGKGVNELASESELNEYLLGGEWDAREEEIEKGPVLNGKV